ncbi:MAG: cadmium-translocating P-type ATPase [Ruminococcus sp.]|nr:cadmium-translocating P-type ATPase [Ruminococcus sp.]
MQVIYRIEHLHCPRCAVEIENALRQLDFIEAVRLSFATQQLHLTVKQTENLLEQVQKIAISIDEGVKILERDSSGHHHVKDYVQQARKTACCDPNCNCCDYLPEQKIEKIEQEISSKSVKIIYDFENIDCPNCAVKIESAIQKLDGIESANLSYATKQLHIITRQPENLLERIQQATDKIESGVIYSVHGEKKKTAPEKVVKIIYDFENIDCPNCASKIENAIQKLDCVETASLSYATKQLHVTTKQPENLLEFIQKATDSVESGVVYHLHETKQATVSSSKKEEHHENTEMKVLIVGAVLFAIGIILEWITKNNFISGIFLLIAYFVMGWEVLFASVKSIGKGQIFDENFLMSIATIGALCIGSVEESAGVMLFFRIGELFEHIAVERSRKSVMNAIDMRPETVQKIFSKTDIRTIPAEKVQIGDLLLVRAGDKIPVDGIVRKGESNIDTSAMTGESLPVSVKPDSEIMSGCMNLNGVIELEATAELKDSMVTRVLDSVESAAAGKPKIDKFITRFAKIYTPIVVAIAVLTAVIPSLITGNWSYWVYAALNFLMISCPCALVLSVPLAFFSGIGAGSAQGILFKDGISLEALAGVKAVVMDKTGTLTKGNFTVTEAETVDCKTEELFKMCASCESYSTHPVAKSILQYMQEQKIIYTPAQEIQELAGRGMIGKVNHMQVACGNEKLMEELGVTYPKKITSGTCVYVAVDGAYYGRLVLSDTPKENAKQTIAELNRKNLYTVMLTGDSSEHTQEIAENLQVQEVHAGLLPTEKPIYMQKIREQHGAVMFVGDGINDAPVLSGADVGAAMGSGADAAMEVADVVLLSSDTKAITTAIEIAQRVNQTSKYCIIFALGIKIAIMILAFFGFANMWLSVFADTGVTILCVIFVLIRVQFYYRKKINKI